MLSKAAAFYPINFTPGAAAGRPSATSQKKRTPGRRPEGRRTCGKKRSCTPGWRQGGRRLRRAGGRKAVGRVTSQSRRAAWRPFVRCASSADEAECRGGGVAESHVAKTVYTPGRRPESRRTRGDTTFLYARPGAGGVGAGRRREGRRPRGATNKESQRNKDKDKDKDTRVKIL